MHYRWWEWLMIFVSLVVIAWCTVVAIQSTAGG